MSIAFRLAWRDLRGGLAGLRLLALCLFLGIGALASIGSLSSAITSELAAQARDLLGGDLALSLPQRAAQPEELARFQKKGAMSHIVRLRAMASRVDGAANALVEVKAVDSVYPLYGRLQIVPGGAGFDPSAGTIAIDPALADQLRLGVGDQLRLGEGLFRIGALIAQEPDRNAGGMGFGPRVLIGLDGLAKTGLIQPGSLYTHYYRLRLPSGVDAAPLASTLSRELRDTGWEVTDHSNANPGARRFIERLGQFLGLIALTALAVAGIGVGNGVASWLESRRRSFATLKVLGATSSLIFASCLIEIGMVAGVASIAGLGIGAAMPLIVGHYVGDLLPVAPRIAIFPIALLTAMAQGLLITLLFTLAPLAEARATSASALFQDRLMPGRWPPRSIMLLMLLIGALIATLAIMPARDPIVAALFLAAALVLFVLLQWIGIGLKRFVARLPRPRRILPRLALANLHRPGAQTDRLIVALGLGLTLFVALAITETSLSHEIDQSLPRRAPAFFALDVPNGEIERFAAVIAKAAPDAKVRAVPSLRGTVVALKSTRVTDMRARPEGAWLLNGDRGVTYAAAIPENNEVVEGRWWPADYAGPPLVSLEAEQAHLLGLKVGDPITVSVLSVEITARIAALRKVNWRSFGINYSIIFAPGALEGAPHGFLATISAPPAQEKRISSATIGNFPSVSLIRVRDVVTQVSATLNQLAMAIRAAAGVTLIAGIAVLTGAIAASRRARLYDSVILKLLGATRSQILGAQAMEYGALALIVSAVALLFGCAAGWYLVTDLFALPWAPDWWAVAATLAIGAFGTLAIGLIGSIPALSARPSETLRSL